MKFTIKRYRVPITRVMRVPNVNPEKSKSKTKPRKKLHIEYALVDMNEFYKDEEEREVEVGNMTALNAVAKEIREYNERQTNMAKNNIEVTTVYKKVLCKPSNTENK